MSAQLAHHVARRIPLIRFTHGKRIEQLAQIAIQPEASKISQVNSSSPRSVNEFYQLPKKYLRKPLAIDEIDAINRGGL